MDKNTQTRVRPNRRFYFFAVFFGTLMMAWRMYAPIEISPPVISISQSTSNRDTVTGTASPALGGSTWSLQMSTNLTAQSWTSIQTNSFVGGSITFTNIPATNPAAFFRISLL
jgi:hypothetical protein